MVANLVNHKLEGRTIVDFDSNWLSRTHLLKRVNCFESQTNFTIVKLRVPIHAIQNMNCVSFIFANRSFFVFPCHNITAFGIINNFDQRWCNNLKTCILTNRIIGVKWNSVISNLSRSPWSLIQFKFLDPARKLILNQQVFFVVWNHTIRFIS